MGELNRKGVVMGRNDINLSVKADQVNALLHELQVHQIELEVQNEELKKTNLWAENAMTKYYEMYENGPIGYFTINEHGRILEVNQASADLLEVEDRHLLLNYFPNFIVQDCLPLYTSFIDKVAETKLKQKCEINLLRKGKDALHVQIIAVPVRGTGNSENCIWLSVLDITDRIMAEEARETVRRVHEEDSNRQLNQILTFDKLRMEYFSNLSHELRTPLNVILSSLKLMELKNNKIQAAPSLKLDKHISTIKQNSYRLLRLVNNIIDSTKIEAGFFEIHLHNYNIVAIVENITLSVAEYIEDKGIELVFDTDIEEKYIACDVDLVERIILNLLSNAVKFTKKGGSITVNMFDMGEQIEISICDTGVGIPANKQEIIFKRFCQVNTSLAKDYEGSGIGLSLVKSLIEMHRGTLSVESEYGKGSKFIISLPAKTCEIDEETELETDSQSEQRRIEKLSIEFSDIYR